MSDEATIRPSSRAVERLARDVGDEVADLRSALRHALDEADRLEAEGRPQRAAEVLTEQQELLASVHRRLEERLAGAAAERAAEGVLAAASESPSTAVGATAEATGATATTAGAADVDAGGMTMRLVASAAAALVGVALLVAPDAGGTLGVAGSTTAHDGVGEERAPTGVDAPGDDVHAPGEARGPSSGGSTSAGAGGPTRSEPGGPHADTPSDGPASRPGDDPPGDLPPLPTDPETVGSVIEGLQDVQVTDLDLEGDRAGQEQDADAGSEDGTTETHHGDGDRDDQHGWTEGSSSSSRVGDLTGSSDETEDPGR